MHNGLSTFLLTPWTKVASHQSACPLAWEGRQAEGSAQKTHRRVSDHIAIARALRRNNKQQCLFPLSHVIAKRDQYLTQTVLTSRDRHIMLLSIIFQGPRPVTIHIKTCTTIWRKENMGCLVLIFNLIHLGILNPENLAPACSILKFKWHTILSFSMANHPFPLKRKFFQCVMHLKNHYITKKIMVP